MSFFQLFQYCLGSGEHSIGDFSSKQMPGMTLLLEYTKNLVTTWTYAWRNLKIVCNKLSSIKQMCPDLFLEEAPCGSILVNDHLPQATLQSLHFQRSSTGSSTVSLQRAQSVHIVPGSRWGVLVRVIASLPPLLPGSDNALAGLLSLLLILHSFSGAPISAPAPLLNSLHLIRDLVDEQRTTKQMSWL